MPSAASSSLHKLQDSCLAPFWSVHSLSVYCKHGANVFVPYDLLGGPNAGQGELLLAVGIERCHAAIGQSAGGETPQEASCHLTGLTSQPECCCPLMVVALGYLDSSKATASLKPPRQAGPFSNHGHVALQAGLERMLK